ncbi:peptidoglycan-binding domain-containing protein [Peribacillus frigoritolerans]
MENGDLRLEQPLSLSKKVQKAILHGFSRLHIILKDSPESLDSIFGKGTETALAKFQKARDISVDRKADKTTFTELFAG